MLNAKTEEEREEFKKLTKEYKRKCFNEDNNSETFSGAVFISFEREEQAVAVVDHFSFTPWK